MPLTPLEPVLRAFRLHPHRTAIRDRGREWSYADLALGSALLGALLRENGLESGGHALLISPNTLHAVLAFHAVPLAGGVIVPLNPAFDDEALNFLAAHADPQVALVDTGLLPRVQGTLKRLGVPAIPIGSGAGLREREAGLTPLPLSVPEKLNERQPISINYTSGTTSDPKGVMTSHRAALLSLGNLLYHLDLRPGCQVLHTVPLAHSNGWGMAWAVTAAGGTHITLPVASDLRPVLESGGVTHLCASPAWLEPLLSGGAALRLPRPVRLVVAGDRPHAPLLTTLQAQGFEVMQGYGLTETAALLTLTPALGTAPPGEPLGGLAPVHPQDQPGQPGQLSSSGQLSQQGHPLTFAGQVQVVGEDGRPVPADGQTPGEVVIRSNQVMTGYYKNPRATRRAVKDGWLHTGDLAVVHPGGSLDILDREGDLLSLAGQPYSSTQIEAVLYRHPSVREAVVVATRDPQGHDRPCGFVTLHPGAQVTAGEILGFCAPLLPPFALPAQLRFVDELPKTASGKVLKHVLRKQLQGRRGKAAPI